LFSSANKVGSAIGTSSSGENDLLPLRLDAPAEFDYGKICPGDIVLLTAAISAPDICAREHDRAWVVNVTGTSKFIQSVIDRGARVVFFPATLSMVNAKMCSTRQPLVIRLANMRQ